MTRVRVRSELQSTLAGHEGWLVQVGNDQHGDFVLVVLDGDPRTLRFGADAIEILQTV